MGANTGGAASPRRPRAGGPWIWTHAIVLAAVVQAATAQLPASPPLPLSYQQAALFYSGSVSAGNLHGCGIRSDGMGFCWGLAGPWIGIGIPMRSSWDATQNVGAGACSCTPYSVNANQPRKNTGGFGPDITAGATGRRVVQVSVGMFTWDSNVNNADNQAATGDTMGGASYGQYQAFTLALLSDGSAVAFGVCNYGQCGTGTLNSPYYLDYPATNATAVVQYDGSGSGVKIVQIAAAAKHSCFLLSTGQVRCSGAMSSNQAGINGLTSTIWTASHADHDFTTLQATLGAPYTSWTLKVVQVAVGGFFTCFLMNTGHVTCFGLNSDGQCGRGNKNAATLPTVAVSLTTPTVQICTGREYACALNVDGGISCWGNSNSRQFNYNTQTYSSPQTVTLNSGRIAISMACGWSHLCYMRDDRAVVCGGQYNNNQLMRSGVTNMNAVLWSTTATWNYGTQGNTVANAINSGSSAVVSCALYTRLGRREIACAGLNYAAGAGTADTNANANTVGQTATLSPVIMTSGAANTMDAGVAYSPFPVVLSVDPGTGAYASNDTHTYVAVTTWVPFDRSSAGGGTGTTTLYFDNTPCANQIVVNSSFVVCRVDSALLSQVRVPPQISYSWFGAPLGAAHSVFTCPRPLTDALVVSNLDTMAPGSITVTGDCFGSQNYPWNTFSQALSATILGGRRSGTISSATATSITIALPTGAGSSVLTITNPAATIPTAPANILITYRAPTITSVVGSRPTGFLAPRGETITVNGRYFGPPGVGIVVVVKLGSTTLSATVVSDSVITATIPPFSGTFTQPLSVTVEGVDATGGVRLTYQQPVVTGVSPAQYYSTTSLASKSFSIIGTGFGTSTADVAYASIGGVNCTSVALVSSTNVTCTLTAAAMTGFSTSYVALVAARMTGYGGNASIFTPLGLPAVRRAVNKAGDPTSAIWLDGASLGYGTPATRTFSGITAGPLAPVVNSIGLFSSVGGAIPCSTRYYPATLGNGFHCYLDTTQTNLSVGYVFVPYVVLEDNIVVTTSTSFTFAFAPVITAVTTTRGSNLLQPVGETITVQGRYFGRQGASLVSAVLLNGVSASFTALNHTACTVTVPAFSGSLSVNLTVLVSGVASNAWTLTFEQATVTTIAPAQVYTSLGVGVVSKWFLITGTGFGLQQSHISSVQIGGTSCSSFTRLSSTQINCTLTAAAIASLSSGTVTVTKTSFASYPASAKLLSLLSTSSIQRVVTKYPFDYAAPIAVVATSMGYGAPKQAYISSTTPGNNQPVIVAAGLYEATNKTLLPCATLNYPSTLGDGFVCIPSVDVQQNVPYRVMVQLEDNITISAPSTITYTATALKLVVTWLTQDLQASALPSSASASFWVTPSVRVQAKTDTGANPVGPVTCMLVLDPASLPPDTSIFSLLVGNYTTSADATGLAVFTFGIVGQSNWNYTLNAQCSYSGGSQFYAPTSIRVRVLPLEVRWSVHPVNGTLVSALPSKSQPAGLVSALTPAPSLGIWAVNGSASFPVNLTAAVAVSTPSVTCAVTASTPIVTEFVSTMGTASTALVASTATGSYSGVGIVGALGVPYRMTAACTWMTSEIISSTSNLGQLVSVRVAWLTPPDPYFIYNTATSTAVARLLQLNATTGLWQPFVDASVQTSDLSCTLTAALTGQNVPVTFLGGAISALQVSNASFTVSPLFMLPVYSTIVGTVSADISLQCYFRGQTMDEVVVPTVMQTLSLVWTSAPTSVMGSASSKNVLQPPLNFTLVNQTGGLLASDSTTSCTLDVSEGHDKNENDARIIVDGVTSITLSGGRGSFSSWYIVGPLQSRATLRVTCSPQQGGPSIVTTRNVTIQGAQVDLVNTTSINATHPRTLVVFDFPATMYARLRIRTPTTSGDPNTYTVGAYSSASAPDAACDLLVHASVPPAANAFLSGDPTAYQAQPMTAAGYINFDVRLSASPGYAVPLVVSCSFGDSVVISSLFYFEVADVMLSWIAAPPGLFSFNTPTTSLSIYAAAVISGASSGVSLPVASSDLACSVAAVMADQPSTAVSFTGATPSAFNPGSSTMVFTGIALSPAEAGMGNNVTVSVGCVLRGAMVVTSIAANTTEQTLSLAWGVPPPANFTASTSAATYNLPGISVLLLDGAGAVLATDSTTLCSLSIASAQTAAGVTITTATVSGTTQAVVAAGVATFPTWSIATMIDSIATLKVTCRRKQGGADITIAADMAARGAEIHWYNSTTLTQSYGIPIFLYDNTYTMMARLNPHIPTSTALFPTTVKVAYDTTQYPAAACSMSVDASAPAAANAYLTGDPSVYNGQRVAADGFVAFSVRLSAEPEMPVPLVLTCTYGDNTISSELMYVQIARLAVDWYVTPLSLFTFNTPTTSSAVVVSVIVPGNETAGTNATVLTAASANVVPADVSCATEVYNADAGGTVPYTGGSPGTMNAGSGVLSITSFAIAPSSASAGFNASIVVICTFRKYMALPSVSFKTTLQELYLSWILSPAVSAMPSTSTQQFLLPDVSLALYNSTGGALVADYTSLCSIGVHSATDASGLTTVQAATVGNTKSTASAGIVTFTGLGINAPFGSLVTLLASCTRVERGPDLTATMPVAMYSVRVRWQSVTSLDNATDVATILYDTDVSGAGVVEMLRPTSRTNSSQVVREAYNGTVAPAATCSLAVGVLTPVPVTINGPSALYQAVAVNTSGYVPVAFRLAAQAANWLPLELQCQVGDAAVTSDTAYAVIAPLTMSFVANTTVDGLYFPPLPTVFGFNDVLPGVEVGIQVQLQHGAATTLIPVPLSAQAQTADFVCSTSASSSASGTTRSVPMVGAQFSGFSASNSSLSMFGAALQPAYAGINGAVDTTVTIGCAFRGLAIPSISFTAIMETPYLQWVSQPQASVQRTSSADSPVWLPAYSVATYNQDGSLNTDAASCAVTCTGAEDVTGRSIAATTIVIGGTTTSTPTNGLATFASWWLRAPLSSTVWLQVVCTPGDGAPSSAITTSVAVQGAQMSWGAMDTLDPTNATTTWFYDTPMNITAVLEARLPTSRNNGSIYSVGAYNYSGPGPSLVCSVAVDTALVAGGAVVAVGGDARQYQSLMPDASGTLRFSVRPVGMPPAVVPLRLSCSLGDASLDPISTLVRVTPLRVDLLDAWPALGMPSSKDVSVPIAPSLRVAVRDEFDQLVTDDTRAACVVTAYPDAVLTDAGTWQALAAADRATRPVSLSGPSVSSAGVRLVGGVATFANVSAIVLGGTRVAFTVQCQRSAGGDAAAVTVNTTIAGFSVVWQNATFPPSRILYNTPYPIGAQLLVQNAATVPPVYAPYDPTLYADASCSLKLDDADVAGGLTLAGGAKAINSHATSNGSLAFVLQVQRAPTYTVSTAHLSVQCQVLGTTVTSLQPAASVIQALVAQFVVPPPERVLPSSGSLTVNVDPAPLVEIRSATGEAVDNAGITCAVTVSKTVDAITDGSAQAAQWFPRVWDPPEGDYNYVRASSAVVLGTLRFSAWWNTIATMDVQCVRPQGDAIVPVSWPLRVARAGFSWLSQPATRIVAAERIVMNLTMLDLDAAVVNNNDSLTICTVTNTDGVPMRQNIGQSEDGVVYFTAMQLVGRVGSQYVMVVTCKYGDIPYPSTLSTAVSIDGCLIGEAPTIDFTSCQNCGDGSYSDGGTAACLKCPFGVNCLEGVLSIQEGYFLALPPEARSDPAKYNVTFLESGRVIATITPTTELHTCWSAESCVVNATERSFGCAEGYTGVLCGVCDENNGWVRQSNHCIKCLNPGLDFFILIAGGLAITMALVFVSLVMDFGNPSDAKTVWRILVNYLSAVGAFSTYVAKGTETFLTSFNIFQSVLSPGSGSGLEISPIQCQLKLGFYTKFTATIFLPVICAAICILINVLNIARYKGSQGWRAFWTELKAFWTSQKAVAVAALVMFMAYPSVTAKAFTMFQCMSTTIAGVHYLALDLSVSCDTPQHALGVTLSWVVIGLLCAGLPILFAWWLIRNEEKVKLGVRSQFFGTFGFLFQGYKTDKPIYYVWEALVMVRKAFIVSIAATTKDPVYQCCSAMLLLVVSLGLQLHVAPFAKPMFNFLEAMTLFALVATMAVSLMFLRSTQVVQGTLSTLTPSVASLEGQAQAKESSGVLNEKTTSALLLIVNMVTVLALVYMFISIKRSEIVRNTTVAEQCLDCCDFGKRRKTHSFVMQELSARLGHDPSKPAKSSRVLPRQQSVDRRVVFNPLTKAGAREKLEGLPDSSPLLRAAPPPPRKPSKIIRANLHRPSLGAGARTKEEIAALRAVPDRPPPSAPVRPARSSAPRLQPISETDIEPAMSPLHTAVPTSEVTSPIVTSASAVTSSSSDEAVARASAFAALEQRRQSGQYAARRKSKALLLPDIVEPSAPSVASAARTLLFGQRAAPMRAASVVATAAVTSAPSTDSEFFAHANPLSRKSTFTM